LFVNRGFSARRLASCQRFFEPERTKSAAKLLQIIEMAKHFYEYFFSYRLILTEVWGKMGAMGAIARISS
jgi:hypothetical protein